METGAVVKTMTSDDALGIQSGLERTDMTRVDVLTGDVMVATTERVKEVDALMGTVDESETALVTTNDETVTSSYVAQTVSDMGVVSKQQTSSYEVRDNLDGALVAAGDTHATTVVDTELMLTTHAQDSSYMHMEDGVMETAAVTKSLTTDGALGLQSGVEREDVTRVDAITG